MLINRVRKWWENKKRDEALSDVRAERRALEDVLNRSNVLGVPPPAAAATYLSQLSVLETRLTTARCQEFDDIIDDAEVLGELRAYFCPLHEVTTKAI